jgi:protein-tyrosine phosphatase
MVLIKLDETFNTRDLGCYSNKYNKHVKPNLLYRSDKLNNLTDSDIKKIKDLGIKRIIDFRSITEKNKYPNRQIDGIEYIEMEIDNSVNISEEIDLIINNNKDPKDFLTKSNETFILHFQDIYTQFLKDILRYKKPTLFHCSAGKDRTGLATVLIYLILDIDLDIILKDYMKSNEYLVNNITDYIKIMKDEFNLQDSDCEKLRPLCGVDLQYINTALKTMLILPGVNNYNDYLEKYLGINSYLKNKFAEYLLL